MCVLGVMGFFLLLEYWQQADEATLFKWKKKKKINRDFKKLPKKATCALVHGAVVVIYANAAKPI